MTKYDALIKSNEYDIISELIETIERKMEVYNTEIVDYAERADERRQTMLNDGYNDEDIRNDWMYKDYINSRRCYESKLEACDNILRRFDKF